MESDAYKTTEDSDGSNLDLCAELVRVIPGSLVAVNLRVRLIGYPLPLPESWGFPTADLGPGFPTTSQSSAACHGVGVSRAIPMVDVGQV